LRFSEGGKKEREKDESLAAISEHSEDGRLTSAVIATAKSNLKDSDHPKIRFGSNDSLGDEKKGVVKREEKEKELTQASYPHHSGNDFKYFLATKARLRTEDSEFFDYPISDYNNKKVSCVFFAPTIPLLSLTSSLLL